MDNSLKQSVMKPCSSDSAALKAVNTLRQVANNSQNYGLPQNQERYLTPKEFCDIAREAVVLQQMAILREDSEMNELENRLQEVQKRTPEGIPLSRAVALIRQHEEISAEFIEQAIAHQYPSVESMRNDIEKCNAKPTEEMKDKLLWDLVANYAERFRVKLEEYYPDKNFKCAMNFFQFYAAQFHPAGEKPIRLVISEICKKSFFFLPFSYTQKIPLAKIIYRPVQFFKSEATLHHPSFPQACGDLFQEHCEQVTRFFAKLSGGNQKNHSFESRYAYKVPL